MKVFGPIPSRRLGRSLGINNIPPKSCSYSCVYCQVGRTSRMMIERQKFYEIEDLLNEIAIKIINLKRVGEKIDYITFVPDGEPTLDVNLGRLIKILKLYNVKIAVITNGSLLWRDDVQEDLFNADLVSIKIDSAIDEVWHKINRPHRKLSLSKVIKGINSFCQYYKGDIITETMLVKGINDFEESLTDTSALIEWINPKKAFLLIPTRPPAESWIKPPSIEVINNAYQIYSDKISNVELISEYEGNNITYTGNLEEELLGSLSVHPMREDAVKAFIANSSVGWSVLQKLLQKKKIVEVQYAGNKFYHKNFVYE